MRLFRIAAAAFVAAMAPTSAIACKEPKPAADNGDVEFEYVVCALAGQSASLMSEIRKEFRRQGVDASELTCTSVKLGTQFRKVGDIRIPPFSCKVGGKYLLINGDVLTYDIDARPGPRPRDTDYLVLSNPKWSWR